MNETTIQQINDELLIAAEALSKITKYVASSNTNNEYLKSEKRLSAEQLFFDKFQNDLILTDGILSDILDKLSDKELFALAAKLSILQSENTISNQDINFVINNYEDGQINFCDLILHPNTITFLAKLPALSSLSDRERNILIARFGIEDGRQKTLEEVGVIYNITPERVRQIEAKALRKLRHPSRNHIIKDFLEN